MIFNDLNYILTEKTSVDIKNIIYKKYYNHHHKHKLFKLCHLYNITKFLLLKQLVKNFLVNDLLHLIVKSYL